MITLKHHGAVTGVTGSCHELRLDAGESTCGLLVDCGLFQGEEAAGRIVDDLRIEFPITHIQALVVTHVHIDHVGRIPYLLAAGFDGPILCSEPSALMLPEILQDALRIGFTRDRDLIERVLERLRSRLVALPYDTWHTVCETASLGLSVRLQRAGHILGSAYVECQARSENEEERIVFSGDLGAPHSPLLPAPRSPERADRLVIESTYGDRNHEDRETRRYRLKQVLEHALADGGTVIVPAFSIGRTQELLYEMESLIWDFGTSTIPLEGPLANWDEGALTWEHLQIIVDSPLAAEFTRLYRQLKPFWDSEAQARVAAGRHPLSFEQLVLIDSHKMHEKAVRYLAQSGRPCVVIAGSGMCAGGRVVNYLKAMLGDARNDVLFVGYQAAGTPGAAILREGPRHGEVELDGVRYSVRAAVHQVTGYSAHAGQEDLLAFIRGMSTLPGEIRLVHGENRAKEALRKCIENEFSTVVTIP